MIDAILLSIAQLSLILLCSLGISRGLTSRYEIPLIYILISVFSLIHIVPSVIFLIAGKPLEQITTVILIGGAIYGASLLNKEDTQSIGSIIKYSPLCILSLIVVLSIRIATIPEDNSLVRGDIVSHIIPIIQWSDGLIGYPGVTYPRGFHGFFLSLSFGLDYSLVSHSVFLTLMSLGWTIFCLILRNHLDDLSASCVLLLSGGAGIVGLPDGLIENTGWWLVRQSNLQPEISAWIFVLSLMYFVDSLEKNSSMDERARNVILLLVILGASTTNPFFFLVCSPFFIIWSLMNWQFERNKPIPSDKYELVLLTSPIIVLLFSVALMQFSEFRFGGSSADIHDPSHRFELLEDELGVYFTDGLNLNTILVMLSPKPELTIGELSIGKVIKLTLLPMWFIVMGALFSRFRIQDLALYFGTVSTLYVSWYMGIPAPDGWSVIRAQYPHRAFAMLLLIPLLKEMKGTRNIILLTSSLIWLSLEPELYFEEIFRYEHAARSMIVCMLFLLLMYIQNFIPLLLPNGKIPKKHIPLLLSLLILGFWGSFNIVKLPNSDFGIMFFSSAILLLYSLWLLNLDEITSHSKIAILSICSGAIFGHYLDFRIGNFHESSFLIFGVIISFIIFELMEFERLRIFCKRYSLWFLFGLLLINSIIHVLNPKYVTPLMLPGFPQL